MSTQFGQRCFQANTGKALGNARAEIAAGLWRFLIHGAEQDSTYFFFHAAAMALCTALECIFQLVIQISYNHLGHRKPPMNRRVRKTISRYQINSRRCAGAYPGSSASAVRMRFGLAFFPA